MTTSRKSEFSYSCQFVFYLSDFFIWKFSFVLDNYRRHFALNFLNVFRAVVEYEIG